MIGENRCWIRKGSPLYGRGNGPFIGLQRHCKALQNLWASSE